MDEKTYEISWQDRLFMALDRLPGPTILANFVLASLYYLIWSAFEWLFNRSPIGHFDPDLGFSVLWLFITLLLGNYLRASARKAIEKFRPALPVSDDEFKEIRQRFLHLSNRTGWYLTLAGVLIAAILTIPAIIEELGSFPNILMLAVDFILTLIMFSVITSVFWYVVYQVLSVPALYQRVREINIFNLGALTAFSDLTLRIALPFILLSGLSYSPDEPLALVFVIADLVLAGLAFIVPLWGMHLQLVEEKNRLQEENSQVLKETYEELHAMASSGNRDGVGSLKTTVSALLEFRTLIASTSTWPWNISTIRSFLSALLLPIALWFIQGFLSQFVTF